MTEFNAHLFEAYQIGLPSITFRDVVGRYIRAYGRGNHDELNPLKYSTVPDAASIIALEKLFNVYAVVEHYQTDYDAKDKRKRAGRRSVISERSLSFQRISHNSNKISKK